MSTSIKLGFRVVQGFDRHAESAENQAILTQYLALRDRSFNETRFSATELNKYDLYPDTTFFYLINENTGELIAGSRAIIVTPESGLKLQFEDLSPYQFSDIAEHLDISKMVRAELSGLCVEPKFKHAGLHLGTKLNTLRLDFLGVTPGAKPDIMVGRILTPNIGPIAHGAKKAECNAIVRTDRITVKPTKTMTTMLLTFRDDLVLASEENLQNGNAVPLMKYYRSIKPSKVPT